MRTTASLSDSELPGARLANRVARWARALSVLALALLCGCSAPALGFLNAHGPVAASERRLFVIVCLVMLFVIGPVLLLTPLFAWHYRYGNRRSAFRPQWQFSWPLEFFIWVPPTLIVIGLAVLLWHEARELDPYTPLRSTLAPLEVQAVGFDWKWLFIYPEAHVASVNELVIPAGRPIHLSLTSATVMQSMLVPQLAGQIYAMAGMRTQLNLQADRIGSFLGENTQFNGVGFPEERFQVVSVQGAAFDRWIKDLHNTQLPLDAAALAKLAAKAAAPHPIFFSTAPPHLFEQIIARARWGSEVSDAAGGHP